MLLETSGAHDVAPVDPRVHIIMDLKCPDSGESHRNRWANLDVLKPTDQIKFVIASRGDWDWTARVIREHRLDERFSCLVSARLRRGGAGRTGRLAARIRPCTASGCNSRCTSTSGTRPGDAASREAFETPKISHSRQRRLRSLRYIR